MDRRVLLFCLSFTIASAAAAAYWLNRPTPEPVSTTKIVNRTKELTELMRERFVKPDGVLAPGADGSWPPPLVREPLDVEVATLFFPAIDRGQSIFDPVSYVRWESNYEEERPFLEHPDRMLLYRTNSLGLRDDEIADPRPRVRILITGDSHTIGVCQGPETFPNVLERLLRARWNDDTVESINAGLGGQTLYNYLGVLERLRDLAPDVFVVTVYGGNDFSAAAVMQRYFQRRGPPKFGPLTPRKIDEVAPRYMGGIHPQELVQVCYFKNNPGDESTAIDVAASISLEIARLAKEIGTRPLFVYLPPPLRVQPKTLHPDLLAALAQVGIGPADIEVSDRIADAWLKFLTERGLAHVDLRPTFAAMTEKGYWLADHHINLRGHEVVAEALVEPLERLLER